MDAGVDRHPTGDDWRAQLQPETRIWIVNTKIMKALKKYVPVSAPKKLKQLRAIAVRYEKRIYTEAINQSDYSRKISLKILSMEKTQHALGDAQVIPDKNNPNKESPIWTMDGPTVLDLDAAAGVDTPPTGGDWRVQVLPETRSRIVDKIMVTLKTRLPISMPEGLNEIHKIAVRFEEKNYTVATNQFDYLWKISLKMISMEMNTQQAPGNAQVIRDQNNSSKPHTQASQKRARLTY